ncbi:hypothetical protein GCM10028818_07720 [Spirosoma horti]
MAQLQLVQKRVVSKQVLLRQVVLAWALAFLQQPAVLREQAVLEQPQALAFPPQLPEQAGPQPE